MDLVYNVLVVLHLIGWAIVLGGTLVNLRTPKIATGVLHGILTALVTVTPLAAQKQAPPPVGRAKNFTLPAKREFTLANGLAVTLVPFGTVPKANIQLAIRASAINESASEVAATRA